MNEPPKKPRTVASMLFAGQTGGYVLADLVEHALRHGRNGVFTMPTAGIQALALGADALIQRLAEVVTDCETLLDLVAAQAESQERDAITALLQRIRSAALGETISQPQEDQDT